MLLNDYYFGKKNRKVSPKWSWPFPILQLKGTHNAEIEVKPGRKLMVNKDRIKPYQEETTQEATQRRHTIKKKTSRISPATNREMHHRRLWMYFLWWVPMKKTILEVGFDHFKG